MSFARALRTTNAEPRILTARVIGRPDDVDVLALALVDVGGDGLAVARLVAPTGAGIL